MFWLAAFSEAWAATAPDSALLIMVMAESFLVSACRPGNRSRQHRYLYKATGPWDLLNGRRIFRVDNFIGAVVNLVDGRRQQLAQDGVGHAEGALAGQLVGHEVVGHVQHVAVDGVLVDAVLARHFLGRAAHLLEHVADEEAFELDGGLVGLFQEGGILGGSGGRGYRSRKRSVGLVQAEAEAGGGEGGEALVHQITTSSPSMAPAWSSACRIAMMSSGVAPRLLTTSMIACSLAPAGHLNIWPEPWSTLTFEFGVTAVWPPENATGWLTFELSEITTFSEPCVTAAAFTRSPSAMTTVPVRELNTTFGFSWPCSIDRLSRRAMKATRWVGFSGATTAMLVASSVLATLPNFLLIESTILVAVSNEGRLSDRRTVALVEKSVAISRSIMAPLGIRPAVGVLTVTDEPLLPAADRPPTTTLPWASAYVSLSAARRGVSSSDPPRRLFASPSDETVTSIGWPRR